MSSGDLVPLASSRESGLDEDRILALLKHADLTPGTLEQLSKHGSALKSRKAKMAIIAHANTPRYVSLRLIRELFTFDLMRAALSPTVPGDIKRAADDVLIHRLGSISFGERLSLARRASGRVAGQLLLDSEPRVIHAALQNSRLSESSIVRAVIREDASARLVHAVCRNAKWSVRHEVRLALLKNKNTPMTRALEVARSLSPQLVRDTMQSSHLPEAIKSRMLEEMASLTR